jgi:hypothetical protein
VTGYELRAEHEWAHPVGRETVRWHIARERHLVALCGRLIDPVSDRRPIGGVDDPAVESRCTHCWDSWDEISEAQHEHLIVAAEASEGPRAAGFTGPQAG